MRSEVHLLKQLGEDECWKVFENHALKDGDLSLNDELKEIGRRIIKKCKGLPLALKTIGCLLRTKSSISDWKNILESDIWELPKEHSEIIPALFLSYRYLPSHLKRCFAYCALFPKDYKFVKEELILLWMAQNFLESPQQIKHTEEVGEEYFNDLLSRSSFQQSSFVGRFIMHDLLNDLAKYVCADFCFRLKFDKGRYVPKTTCHFSFEFYDVKSFDGLESLTNAKRIRSFLPISQYERSQWHFKISIHDLFSKIKFIRVLSFHGCSDLGEVPDSVGDLKHLHSLDLSHTGIQKLRDSICWLYNLLILKLNGCLELEELPLNLHKLTKLRCLEFEDTKVTKMPLHFGELKNLQALRRISLESVNNHLMLLHIEDCPQFKSFLFPKPMQILFPSLTYLYIERCPEVELFPDGGLPLNIKEMSLSSLKLIASLRENLDPNTCLQTLYILKLEVECFPDEVLLPRSLTSLHIQNCRNLKTMHYKGLCHLSSLTLYLCPSLECLPAEGLPKSISSLTIWDSPLLKERCRNPDGEDWGKIAHIQKLAVGSFII